MAGFGLSSLRLSTAALGAALALGAAAHAADVTVQLDVGAGLSIKNNTGAIERLRVDEATGNLSRNGALFVHTTGLQSVFVGPYAGNTSTTGQQNSAVGRGALGNNTTGEANTAVGRYALGLNTGGSRNTAVGSSALLSNTGSENSAFGTQALFSNTTGFRNSAFGYNALGNNTTGLYNAAFGNSALGGNTGSENSAFGSGAIQLTITNSKNSAFGRQAMQYTTGIGNTAVGRWGLRFTTGGNYNVAVGMNAGVNQTTGSNNIYLKNDGVAGESGQIKIGTVGTHTATTIAGIHGATSSGGIGVLVNASGTLGTTTSSLRFKQNVHDMRGASDVLMKLRPVVFQYREEAVGAEEAKATQYGLIAEEVAQVAPELVAPDLAGKPYSVRYHVLPALLVNEVQRQERVIAALSSRLEALEGESGAACIEGER